MLKITAHIYRTILHALFIQIILAFVTMPLLIGWGLPISLAGFLSNLIFAPMLCTFLIGASIVFITEILNIPNGLLVAVFDRLSSWWLKLLATSKPCWLIGFPAPPALILGATTLIGLGFVIFTKRMRIELRMACAILLLGSIMGGYHFLTPRPSHCTVQYKGHQITVQKNQQGLTLIVPPLRAKPEPFLRWITMYLKSALYRHYGSTALHQIVLTNPSQQIIDHLKQSSSIVFNWLTIIQCDNKLRYSTITHQAMPALLFCTTQHEVDQKHSPQTIAPTKLSAACASVKNILHLPA